MSRSPGSCGHAGSCSPGRGGRARSPRRPSAERAASPRRPTPHAGIAALAPPAARLWQHTHRSASGSRAGGRPGWPTAIDADPVRAGRDRGARTGEPLELLPHPSTSRELTFALFGVRGGFRRMVVPVGSFVGVGGEVAFGKRGGDLRLERVIRSKGVSRCRDLHNGRIVTRTDACLRPAIPTEETPAT